MRKIIEKEEIIFKVRNIIIWEDYKSECNNLKGELVVVFDLLKGSEYVL